MWKSHEIVINFETTNHCIIDSFKRKAFRENKVILDQKNRIREQQNCNYDEQMILSKVL